MNDEFKTTDAPMRCENLPPEVAVLLIMIGAVGVPLPGPGFPFILAGGLALWPRTFRPIEAKFREKCPESHSIVARILYRFEHDLENRYPRSDSTSRTSQRAN